MLICCKFTTLVLVLNGSTELSAIDDMKDNYINAISKQGPTLAAYELWA